MEERTDEVQEREGVRREDEQEQPEVEGHAFKSTAEPEGVRGVREDEGVR